MITEAIDGQNTFLILLCVSFRDYSLFFVLPFYAVINIIDNSTGFRVRNAF